MPLRKDDAPTRPTTTRDLQPTAVQRRGMGRGEGVASAGVRVRVCGENEGHMVLHAGKSPTHGHVARCHGRQSRTTPHIARVRPVPALTVLDWCRNGRRGRREENKGCMCSGRHRRPDTSPPGPRSHGGSWALQCVHCCRHFEAGGEDGGAGVCGGCSRMRAVTSVIVLGCEMWRHWHRASVVVAAPVQQLHRHWLWWGSAST